MSVYETIGSSQLLNRMIFSGLLRPITRRVWSAGIVRRDRLQRWLATSLSVLTLTLGCLLLSGNAPAWAGINDDKFDGNIFALYAGNGSLVPPSVTLKEALKQENDATLLMFYLDDSSDCKQFSPTISRLQAFYGRAANFVPYNVDAIEPKSEYDPTEPGYYYKGAIPQTVVFDPSGNVVFNEVGQVPFEKIDDAFREMFDLPPRSDSGELQRRQFNEFNIELSD